MASASPDPPSPSSSAAAAAADADAPVSGDHLSVPSAPPAKKPQPIPWTPQETTYLIEAYQEKWYSLKRGQLKASQWEEVAVTVAARCGYDADDPSKSATQCRHKIEKLRKRFRSEKQRATASSWQFFPLMDRLERGPLPISARPISTAEPYPIPDETRDRYRNRNRNRGDSNLNLTNKSRSINYIVRKSSGAEKSTVDFNNLGDLRDSVFRRSKRMFQAEEDEDGDEEEEGEEGRRKVLSDLAGEIRAFAERFVKMENKKLEMMKEAERYRMEMENKRMEMILESQRKIVETISRTIGSHKKLKMDQ